MIQGAVQWLPCKKFEVHSNAPTTLPGAGVAGRQNGSLRLTHPAKAENFSSEKKRRFQVHKLLFASDPPPPPSNVYVKFATQPWLEPIRPAPLTS